MGKLHNILEELNLNDSLQPWKSFLKTGWLGKSWRYLFESYPAEYQDDPCESVSVFLSLMAIYVSFTRIVWDSVDAFYMEDLANSANVSHAKFGLLASKYAPDYLEFLLRLDDYDALNTCLETIIEALRPGILDVLEKSYGGDAQLSLSLLNLFGDENFFKKEDLDDDSSDPQEAIASNWETFSGHICFDEYDFATYMEHQPELPENIVARWVIQGCPIFWDRLH